MIKPIILMLTALSITAAKPITAPGNIEYIDDLPVADIELILDEPTQEPRTYNGITEGDIIIGELTHYDVCLKCCGKLNGVTASGLVIKNGVEPEMPVTSCNWLPFGTMVEIDGITHIVADRGGKDLSVIGRFDIFVPEGHQKALALGRKRGIEIIVLSLPDLE